MGKEREKSASMFSTGLPYQNTKTSKQIANSQNLEQTLKFPVVNVDNTPPLESEAQDTDDEWELVGTKKLKKIRKNVTKSSSNNIQSHHITNQTVQSDEVHSYFLSGRAEPNSKPRSNQNRFSPLPRPGTRQSTQFAMTGNTHERNTPTHLPPFKIVFEDQQKPPEIQVLNDLVKHNSRLNVTAASYSKHLQSEHVLLLFVNDSSIYELLFKNTSWPKLICNRSFQVTLPRRIPPSYSVIVNRIPRDWNIDTLQPLLIERYSSTTHITRIFRDGQPTTRIRIDFQSQTDVQSIVHTGHIYIDSVRYPATSYKPLLRINRCYKCQQYGHTFQNCTNASKCFKCGELHLYNPHCANTIKCANCAGSHMAGSPECPVKISYRKQQQQHPQQQQTQQMTEMMQQSPTANYLPSPARLYSSVLQTISSNSDPTMRIANTTPRPASEQTDSSSAIIQTIKDEIGKSQNILLERFIQLDQKCEAATQQYLKSQHVIQTEILPYLMPMSELIVNIYDTLIATQLLSLTDQQQVQLTHIRNISAIHQTKSSKPLRPLLSRTRAQPNLCSSLTSLSNPPHLVSIPSDSNFDETSFSPHNFIQ